MVEDIFWPNSQKLSDIYIGTNNIWVNSKINQKYMVERKFEQKRNLVRNIWWVYETFDCVNANYCIAGDVKKNSPKSKKSCNT